MVWLQYNGNADDIKSGYSDRNEYKLHRVKIYYNGEAIMSIIRG